jgi:hypothetical protein
LRIYHRIRRYLAILARPDIVPMSNFIPQGNNLSLSNN